ncbi:MAG: monofunctional biosynthetic peptidoglycan transglycosylase [Bacteroidetes bacterium]|nr:monofunctional biosynthetic peptidoglycan transglycosylase [Bacteroidota bacterium]
MREKLFSWLYMFWKLFLVLFIAQLVYIFMLRWVNPPITATQLSSWLHGPGLARHYVPYTAMSPHIRLAVMASEDQLFPQHNGFDVESIKLALKEKDKRRKQMRGASTISQQVAKNVFLWQGRSWLRKGLEAYFTFMIEWTWGKKRILEMYLNVSEMGNGIFGIEAAAQSYFHKPAKKLSRAEAAMIAACLPSPRKIRVQPPSNYVSQRYPQIMEQMDNLEPDEAVSELLK